MISKPYIESLAAKGTRFDGRKFDEYRPIEIEYGVSSKSAEGSARVKIGDTEVFAGVKLDLGEPFPDKPGEGTIVVNAELLPISSPLFESGPPGVDAIELSRVTDRGIRECNAIDFKKLCVVEGEKVWLIFIDIYPINADGNLFDACTLAAMAALQNTKFPKLTENYKVDYNEKTNKSLVLNKLPVSCTVWKIKGQYIIDPRMDEEEAAEARISMVFTEDGKICAMQKGGDGSLLVEDIEKMAEIAQKATEELRRHLKK